MRRPRSDINAEARLKRGFALMEYEASGLTQYAFALRRGVTEARMSQILSKARAERAATIDAIG